MPRGKTAKCARAHRRACESGRSTRGSATVVCNQTGGKKYKKGESSSHIEYNNKKGVYDGNEYYIIYDITPTRVNVLKVGKVPKNGYSNSNSIKDYIVEDMELKQKICEHILTPHLLALGRLE